MTRGAGSRIVEVSSPALTLVRALEAAGAGAAIGTGFTFLGVLVLGIVGEEALSAYYSTLDLDPLFRSSMGALLVVALVLGAIVPWLFLVDRFVVLGVAERQAATHAASVGDQPVPAKTFRTSLSIVPGTGLVSGGIVIMLTAGLLGAVLLGMIVFDEEMREEPFVWIAFVVFAAITGAGAAMKAAAARVIARTEPRVQAVRQRWSRALREAERADAVQRDAAPLGVLPRVVTVPSAHALDRSAIVVAMVTFAAIGVFVVSVLLRQQCRSCDPITWIDPVETGIDVLSLASGGALMLCAIAGAAMWIASLLLQRVRERSMRAWVADGAPRRVDEDALRPFLIDMRAAERFARALGALGAAALVFGTGIDWSGWGDVDPLPVQAAGAVSIVAAVLISILDSPRARSERQALRDAAFPGDIGPAAPAQPGKGRAARRDRRRVRNRGE
ncbi:hypothetical protein [Microbacterium sp. SD291]|uniref:hypothetical protein n=1 Tax=Microbacterium sp. SD291 TaxID=2782007 RepID=UPI001A97ABAA|nr:hypothetical protein [Microbacterium sp. SD291]MBO0981936.1 hypothetical protein [Microbacterium sp. SD291]